MIKQVKQSVITGQVTPRRQTTTAAGLPSGVSPESGRIGRIRPGFEVPGLETIIRAIFRPWRYLRGYRWTKSTQVVSDEESRMPGR